tara:strand:- start:9222 stop:9374 length:153 start_codon:yes stop_codon:yes gene_type:complete
VVSKKIKAPKGFHWMKKGEVLKLMKHGPKPFKKHKGASLYASFKIQKKHK